MTAPTRDEVRKRYKRFMAGAKDEHDRYLDEIASYSQGYGLNSIQGEDFAELERVWGKNPPEIGIIMANVDAFVGGMLASRREPTFPGFDQGSVDEIVGEFITMLVSKGRKWARSDDVDEAAVMDATLGGIAFAMLTLDTDRRPPFRPEEEYLPADRVFWDPGHTKKNMGDAQEFAARSFYRIEKAAGKWPEHEATIRALELGGTGGKTAAPGAGSKRVGGPAISVKVTSTQDGGEVKAGDDGNRRRLREVAVDDFIFVHDENLVSWEIPGPDGEPIRLENEPEVYRAWVDAAGEEARAGGQPFAPPPTLPYTAATWYRVPVLAKSVNGDEVVLADPEPIPGNQRLIRALTFKGEWIRDGERLKRRWFGWGRALLGLQKLVTVAIRIEIEQEARRNRASGAIEEDAFGGNKKALEDFINARARPGAWPTVPPGAWEKIHEFQDTVGGRVGSMREIFSFLAVELPKYILGQGEMNRGTFDSDRSVKLVDTMLQQSNQMQQQLASSFTSWLDEGGVTMARLMLGEKGLDAEDIDKILGATGAKLREGITGQKNPETGEVEPVLVPDPNGEIQIHPETGEETPAMLELTAGRFLKENAGEIFQHDINFALRPTAASERAANAQLMLQHGALKEMLAAGAPPQIVLPHMLRASFAQGTEFADMAAELDAYYAELKAQNEEAAKAASEEGWVQFIAGLAEKDLEKALELMKQANDAVMGPGALGDQGAAPGGEQGGMP